MTWIRAKRGGMWHRWNGFTWSDYGAVMYCSAVVQGETSQTWRHTNREPDVDARCPRCERIAEKARGVGR